MADNIQIVYAERFAEDIEKNRSEQEDIARQLAELQSRLDQLKTDEKWLAEMLGTVPPAVDSTPEASEVTPATVEAPLTTPSPAEPDVAVPQPRQEKPRQEKATSKPAQKAASKKPVAKTPVAKKPVARKTVAKKATPDKAASPQASVAKKTDEPPLRSLIESILTKHAGEPRLVSEIRTELVETYPERTTSIQVVRNNLESLTKKGIVAKGTQQGSVMYSKPAPAETPDEENVKAPTNA
ncbi:hypothetical protein ACFVZW_06965 [Streptomyces sp. NPDC059567]|uniref:hypothetical protein n=1 Tax=Streptomyces sp. NPDC059567 TaxID=3346867 RepID=UPI0036B4C1E1